MRTIVNTAQSEAWNGAEGRHWRDRQDRWNAVNEGFNQPLLDAAAIGPAAHHLAQLPAPAVARAHAAATAFLQHHTRPTGVHLRTAAWLVTARRA